MTTTARTQYDPISDRVAITVVERPGDGYGAPVRYVRWDGDHPNAVPVPPDAEAMGEEPANATLALREDHARAVYEALADYFGHAGHDTRTLRRDYEAERGRVDLFIRHLTGGTR